MSEVLLGKKCRIVAVKQDSADFLQFVDKIGLKIQDEITVISKEKFDSLTTIEHLNTEIIVSPKFTDNIFVVCSTCLKAKDCQC